MGKIMTLMGLLIVLLVPAQSYAAARDCDTNAMVYCGAYSKDELIRKITQGDGQHSSKNIRTLFERYDIMPRDIRSSSTVNGEVRKDGTIWVGDKKVATSAYSYGRTNLAGSTRQGSLYKRPTSTSLNSSSLPAYVHMTNGKFDWAIIKSCGNLVTAAPVAVKKVVKPPQPVIIQQPAVVQQTVVQQVVNTNVVQPAPPTPKTLPQTGLEAPMAQNFLALGSISAGMGLLAHSRQRLIRKLTQPS